MKLLNAVFSHNRVHLLRNTLESLLMFGPKGETVVVDDGSTDPRALSLLQEMEQKKVHVLRRSHGGGYHGGLYDSMNVAVDWARGKDFTHIFFIQDDLQFMWKDPDFEKRIETVFQKRTDAAMVSPMFQKGITRRTIATRLQPFPDAQAWHMAPYGIADIGIMPLDLIEKRKFRFLDSEGNNSSAWYDKGYKLYVLSVPSVAWVPWPEITAYGRTVIPQRAPARDFYLKPLTPEQQTWLESKAGSEIPFHEDYCLPWGRGCLAPYWFTRGFSEYFNLLRSQGQWPVWKTGE